MENLKERETTTLSLFRLRTDTTGVGGHGAGSIPLPPLSSHLLIFAADPPGSFGCSLANPAGSAICGCVEHAHGTMSETLQRLPGPARL